MADNLKTVTRVMSLATGELGLATGDSLKHQLLVDVLRQFRTARLAVTGSSMLPALWPGDVVTLRSCDSADLQAGQIVLVQCNENLIAHRIQSIAEDRIVTQGDSMPQCDLPLAASEILGQVVSILRNGRNIPLEQSHWQRAVSWLLRRSDFCLRMTLRVGRRWQRIRAQELLWAR